MRQAMLTVLNGDAVDELGKLPDASVQLTVTSPPYDNLRTYGGHSWGFEGIAKELYRVTCDGGVVCWNVGDAVLEGSETLTSFRQAIYFKDVAGFRVHDTMIYEKVNFSFPSHVRYHQTFEYVFIMSKGQPKSFNAIKDKKNIYAGGTTMGRNTQRQANGNTYENKRNIVAEFGMRGNVWRGNTGWTRKSMWRV